MYKCSLPRTASVFQAKVIAIQKAGEYASTSDIIKQCSYIKILCDSQAAIKAFNSNLITSKSVYRAIDAWETCGEHLKHITLAWIKAHVGHIGNEQADKLAKAGTKCPQTLSDFTSPHNQTIKTISSYYQSIWEDRWTRLKEHTESKKILLKPDKILSKNLLNPVTTS